MVKKYSNISAMKIYVDESFVAGNTIIAAIYISDTKAIEAYKNIKRTLDKNGGYHYSELKKSLIRRDFKKRSIHKIIAKIIFTKSERLRFVKKKALQHTPEFYKLYSIFLKKLRNEFPNVEIIVDKFSGYESIDNYENYTFQNSFKVLGLQLADIAVDNHNVGLEY